MLLDLNEPYIPNLFDVENEEVEGGNGTSNGDICGEDCDDDSGGTFIEEDDQVVADGGWLNEGVGDGTFVEEDYQVVVGTGEQSKGVDEGGIEQDSLEGLVFESLEAAFTFFSRYAIENGFKARRNRVRKRREVVYAAEFCCHRQGTKNSAKNKDGEVSYWKHTLRCGCTAHIWFKCKEDGQWICVRHNRDHNHPFMPTQMRHLLSTSKEMTREQFGTLMSLVNSGIRVIDTFRVLNNEAGGPEQSGIKKKTLYNKVASVRAEVAGKGDAASLVESFKERAKTDPDFFYAIEVDEMGRLSNFFWRDGQMKADYLLFGDLVSVDTTYRTNRYNMFCVPIVGANHHRQNVMFGYAFLVEQKARAFEWLLKTFLSSMDGIEPKTLFSDQDNAFLHAFDSVFKETKHRLCLWHISEKVPTKLRHLCCRVGFRGKLMKCIYDCLTEDELERNWNEMCDEFGCSDDNWLKSLWRIRERWAPCLCRDIFSAGTLSTQRSESTNSVLTSLANKQMGLLDIFKAIEVRVKEWRHNELETDFNNSGEYEVSLPNDILIHASTVYSFRLFKDFQEQFSFASGVKFQFVRNDGGVECYNVSLDRRDPRVFFVRYEPLMKNVECSCKFFNQQGYLCAHALRILDLRGEERIPDQYIMKRWSRNARTYSDELMGSTEGQERLQRFCWRTNTMRKCYNLVARCMNDSVGRKCFDEGLQSLKRSVRHLYGSTPEFPSYLTGRSSQLKDPEFVKANTFGRKRCKSVAERLHSRTRKRK